MLGWIRKLLRGRKRAFPEFTAGPVPPVSPEERPKLMRWFNDPMTQRAFAIVEQHRPGVFSVQTVHGGKAQEAQNFLSVLQGWELYRIGIRTAIFGAQDKVKDVQETFEEDAI